MEKSFTGQNTTWCFDYTIKKCYCFASMMPLIPTDKQWRHNKWFSKIDKQNEGFIDDVEAWFKVTNVPSSHPIQKLTLPEGPRGGRPCKRKRKQGVENGEEHQFQRNPQNDEQDEVAPSDNISIQSSMKFGAKSNPVYHLLCFTRTTAMQMEAGPFLICFEKGGLRSICHNYRSTWSGQRSRGTSSLGTQW